MIDSILKNIKEYLGENTDGLITDVILFGSRARGNYSETSDYDILLITSRRLTSHERFHILDLCYDLDIDNDILMDVHFLPENEKNTLRGRQPVYRNAIDSGVYA